MLKLFDEQKREAQEAKAQQEYADIVEQLAAGEEIDFSQIINVLVGVGRTAVQLCDDVAVKQHENP